MFNRLLKTATEKDLEAMPVVAILGPLQVGKTTLGSYYYPWLRHLYDKRLAVIKLNEFPSVIIRESA